MTMVTATAMWTGGAGYGFSNKAMDLLTQKEKAVLDVIQWNVQEDLLQGFVMGNYHIPLVHCSGFNSHGPAGSHVLQHAISFHRIKNGSFLPAWGIKLKSMEAKILDLSLESDVQAVEFEIPVYEPPLTPNLQALNGKFDKYLSSGGTNNFEEIAFDGIITPTTPQEAAIQSHTPRYLCTMACRATGAILTTFGANAHVLPCDWAITFYEAADVTAKEEICNLKLPDPYRIVHCAKATTNAATRNAAVEHYWEDIKKYGHGVQTVRDLSHLIGKHVMYRDILKYLSEYDAVITFDSDISFVGRFNFSRAIELWRCSFLPHPPLIFQPVIHEPTQDYPHLRTAYWEDKDDVLMHTVQLVEIQVGFYDAKFFQWYIRNVLSLMQEYHLVYGNDWGSDYIRCRAAKEYGVRVLGWQGYDNACAVLADNQAVHHLDSHAINKTNTFINCGTIVSKLYSQMFPTWHLNDMWYLFGILDRVNASRNIAITSINPQCAYL
jgi:hypothetical protein